MKKKRIFFATEAFEEASPCESTLVAMEKKCEDIWVYIGDNMVLAMFVCDKGYEKYSTLLTREEMKELDRFTSKRISLEVLH